MSPSTSMGSAPHAASASIATTLQVFVMACPLCNAGASRTKTRSEERASDEKRDSRAAGRRSWIALLSTYRRAIYARAADTLRREGLSHRGSV
jgi:hypothetical protein